MKMKKSTDLLQGNGEMDWITANGQHIPVGEKESKEEAVKKFVKSHENKAHNVQKEQDEQIDEREQSSENLPKLNKNKPPPDEEAEELKKAEEQKQQELEEKKKNSYFEKVKQQIMCLKPVELELNGKKIVVEFDEGTFEKNIHQHCKSSPSGFRYKKKNIEKWRDILIGAKYSDTAPDSGDKKGKRHDNTADWLYYKKTHKDGDRNFNVIINIRKHKDDKYFVDELAFKLKKKKKAKQKEQGQKNRRNSFQGLKKPFSN